MPDIIDSIDKIAKALENQDGSFAPDITDPQDGDTLVYNGTTEKWENGAVVSGGGVLVAHFNEETGALDKTWQQIKDAGFAVLNIGQDVGLLAKIIEGGDHTDYSVGFVTFAIVDGQTSFDSPLNFMSTSATGELVMADD